MEHETPETHSYSVMRELRTFHVEVWRWLRLQSLWRDTATTQTQTRAQAETHHLLSAANACGLVA